MDERYERDSMSLWIILSLIVWFGAGPIGYVLARGSWRRTVGWDQADRALHLGLAVLLPPVLLVVGLLLRLDERDTPARW